MAEFDRTEYDFNSRFTLNDDTTNADKYALVDPKALLDTLAENVEESKPTEPGIIDYGVKFGKGTAVIPIELVASSESNMADLIQDIKEAFNPDLLELDSTYGETTKWEGYHPLKWTETVGGTSRDFQIYLKSMETPNVEQDSMGGLFREAKLKLKAMDPRKYLQAQTTLSGLGAAVNAGTYTTPVEITVTASGGSTSTSLQIINATRVPADVIYVTTALADGESLVIDTLRHTVKLDGVEKRSMIGSNSEWWNLYPGSNTITANNTSNATFTFKWNSAWPL